MQTPSKQEPGVTGLGALRFVKEAPNVNGGGFSNGQGSFTLSMGGEGAGHKRSAADAGFGESDSDSDTSDQLHGGFPGPGGPGMPGPKPGKKTKGRVKIKMEFIENKLRRYTTFSKRKTGIMKKAYELSTLTGTQVMLLVASETGHVYTFATRKLQPMITSESGKALIQTCLNSPDPPPVGPGQQIDQRMNPSGFEETELSYAVADEDAMGKPDAHEMVMATGVPKAATLFSSTASYAPSPPGSSTPNTLTVQPAPQQSPIPMTAATPVQPQQPQPQQQHQQQQQQTVAMTTYLTSSSAGTNGTSSSKAQSISMQLPTGGLTALIPQTASIPPGTPITISPMPQGQQGGSQQVFRVPAQSQFIQVPVSVPSSNPEPVQQTNSSATLQQPTHPTTQAAAPASGSAPVAPQGTIMYQTPQGVVYAAPSANTLGTIPEGYILNIPQAPTFTVSQEQQGNAPAQQYITIPVPVSLAGSTPILQPVIAHPAGDGGGDDKVRK